MKKLLNSKLIIIHLQKDSEILDPESVKPNGKSFSKSVDFVWLALYFSEHFLENDSELELS